MKVDLLVEKNPEHSVIGKKRLQSLIEDGWNFLFMEVGIAFGENDRGPMRRYYFTRPAAPRAKVVSLKKVA